MSDNKKPLTKQTLQKNTSVASENLKTLEKEEFYDATVTLSIRRSQLALGLPGDDPATQTLSIGSALKGRNPLSGLSMEEEIKYLPEIINTSPQDVNWRTAVRNYWNNIREIIPSDAEAYNQKIPGRIITFTVRFENKKDYDAFVDTKSFEQKAEISKRGVVHPDGVADYILFRYCLVYGKVANREEDKFKSRKIMFFLYSKENNLSKEYSKFQNKNKALLLFSNLLSNEETIDNIIRLYGKSPENKDDFETLEDKHLFLNKVIEGNPVKFIDFANDKNLKTKALILGAVEQGLINNPPNTTTYYFGEDNDTLLGTNLKDAVSFFKRTDEKSKQIIDIIKTALNIN